ncbi:hypothetical protein KGF56_004004 [Candida oxycetoniae]|uniref:C2H2-type domain-containing protein n=1 Tax=Candida oxycetoniae TaxID=497107 RepID=A0AAI9SUA3_9ASCO|nr:uncharacterized protein KGF56_004004 [Candida oxycetoniae]KAI3403207.2 hypothetical protein KGF56_004004 [Candida oxycetoniae]
MFPAYDATYDELKENQERDETKYQQHLQLQQQQRQGPQLPLNFHQLNQINQLQLQKLQRHQPILPLTFSQQISPPQPPQPAQHLSQQFFEVTESSPIPILKSSPEPIGNNHHSETPMRKSKSGNDQLGIDNICRFCHKHFTHKGSLMRHLDLKKGDSFHPTDQINSMRNNSHLRRKSIDTISFCSATAMELSPSINRITTPTTPTTTTTTTTTTATRKRRSLKKSMARSSMSSDSASGQKEKSKLRRKLRDRRIKAKILTNEWFLDLFTKLPLPDVRQNLTPATFCHFVAFYIPLKNWPSLTSGYPSAVSFGEVTNQLRLRAHENFIPTLTKSFQVYEQLDITQKREAWLNEIQQCLLSSISEFSLCDLNNVNSIIDKKEQSIFEQICANDNLSAFVDIDENPTVEEEEEEEENEEEELDTNSLPINPLPPPPPPQQQQPQQPQQQLQPQPNTIMSHQNIYNSQLPNLANYLNDFSSSHFY